VNRTKISDGPVRKGGKLRPDPQQDSERKRKKFWAQEARKTEKEDEAVRKTDSEKKVKRKRRASRGRDRTRNTRITSTEGSLGGMVLKQAGGEARRIQRKRGDRHRWCVKGEGRKRQKR